MGKGASIIIVWESGLSTVWAGVLSGNIFRVKGERRGPRSYGLDSGHLTSNSNAEMKTLTAIVVVGICGILDGVEAQFGGGGGPLLNAISNVVPGGCATPGAVQNFELEEVQKNLHFHSICNTSHISRGSDKP